MKNFADSMSMACTDDFCENDLEYAAGRLLAERQLTIACAESCTGGLLSGRLTAVPGSSAYVIGGVVSYTNEVKVSHLGVRQATLDALGAVSGETAGQMAEGIRHNMHTDIGVGITGIAGPGGATADKPVGLVYISVSGCNGTVVTRNVFQGNRQQVRWQATEKALSMVIEYVMMLPEKMSAPSLL